MNVVASAEPLATVNGNANATCNYGRCTEQESSLLEKQKKTKKAKQNENKEDKKQEALHNTLIYQIMVWPVQSGTAQKANALSFSLYALIVCWPPVGPQDIKNY